MVPYISGFFCVKSTGVFCRASCRSKIPKRTMSFLKVCKETRSFKDVMNCLFFGLMTH
ncbi:Ada metal-binding domain-containing protein, partial [Ligilactobacillus ruminis]